MPADPPPDWILDRRRALGERIRAARLRAHLSQHRVAERAGLDHKTVHRIEAGSHSATFDTLLLIADVLGVPLADLVSEQGEGITEL